MKNLITAVLVGSLTFFAAATQAQTTAPATIEYSENVTVENSDPHALYQRALSWAEGQFPYTPKTDLLAQKETQQIRVTGTSKVKTIAAKASGPEQECALRFDFTFRLTEEGYTYTVGALRVVPDAKQPTTVVPLAEYVLQLSQERSDDRTHNARRVTAQATAVTSDIASAFRSYMNSQPVIEDGEVGLPTNDG